MSDTMLMGVLRMSPKLWRLTRIDIKQRHERYVQAADRIEELKSALRESMEWNWNELVSPPEEVIKKCEKALEN